MIGRVLLPPGVPAAVLPLLWGRALRAFADGYVVVLLLAYLLALGFGTWEVGLFSSTTLFGSALATLAVGAFFFWSGLCSAASVTAVPRSLASAAGPSLGGAMLAAGWLAAPLLACGALKIAYDLALWRAFRKVEPALH